MVNSSAPQPDTEPAEEILEITIRLRSGKFESSISIPLYASENEKKAFVDSWLALMAAGLRCGSTKEA